MNIKKVFTIGSAAAIMTISSVLPAFAATNVVHPGDMQGWAFAQETPTGSGAMVSGPGAPPLGGGSANLVVNDTGGEILARAGYQGLKLADITTLKYSTYRTTGGPALAIALQFNFDGDVTDTNNAFQGRLVYEPYHTQTVTTGAWQTWDALNDTAGTGTGNWWFSNGTHANNSGCSQATPCTWTEVKAAFPNGGVHNTLGAVVLKAGSGWTGGFNGNVDALTVNSDIYNFELYNVPTNYSQCSGEGWKNFQNPPFEDREDCLDYVEDNDVEIDGEIKYTANGLRRTAEFDMSTAENSGTFLYRDANRGSYTVRISEVKVSGSTVWFAGRVTQASNPAWVGQWLFAKVTENDSGTHQIWGSFTNESTAVNGVRTMGTPADGPFNVTDGDVDIDN